MIACSIIGYKNAGKTTLTVKLAEELKKLGKSVAIVKHASHFDEPEHSDTAQFKKVGDMVVGLSPQETIASWPEEKPLLSVLPMIEAEVLLVEGGKKLGYLPRIVVLGPDDGVVEEEELSRGLALAIVRREEADPAALAKTIADKGFLLPGLSCGSCGRKGCTQMTRDIVSGSGDIRECTVMNEGGVVVTVGGKELDVNPFVGRFLASGLRGMLSELKGFGPGKIEITID